MLRQYAQIDDNHRPVLFPAMGSAIAAPAGQEKQRGPGWGLGPALDWKELHASGVYYSSVLSPPAHEAGQSQ